MMGSELSIFKFENITFLSDRDLLTLLKQIDNVTLLRACKQCDERLIHRIACQFSEAGRQYFFEDLQKLGVASAEEILAAQNKIGCRLSDLFNQGRLKDWVSTYAS